MMVLLAPQTQRGGINENKFMCAPTMDLTDYKEEGATENISLDGATGVEEDVITINVGGSRHEISQCTLNRLPSTRLAKLHKQSHHYRKDKDEYFYDRDSGIFSHVLNFYRTGQLHTPRDSCSIYIKQELDFWGISETEISDCCWLQYQAQWDQKETLARFDIDTVQKPPMMKGRPTCMKRFKIAGWKIMEDSYSSTHAKIFSVVSVTFVLLSLTVFVLETHPFFKQDMTAEDYAEYYHVDLDDLLKNWEGDRPPGAPPNEQEAPPKQQTNSEWVDQQDTNKLETNPSEDTKPMANDTGKRIKRSVELDKFNNVEADYITLSYDDLADLINYANEQLEKRTEKSPSLDHRPQYQHTRVKRESQETTTLVPENITSTENGTKPYKLKTDLGKVHPVLQILNKICGIYFTLELIARFVFCPKVSLFFTSVLNIVDIVAVFPFYVTFVINYCLPETKYEATWLDFVMILRTARVFRIFRLMKHNRGLQVLLYTLRASCREMLLMVLFLLLGMLMYGSLIYLTNHDTVFISIPHSFWWAIVTMTTVGYGDMYPTSDWGYLVGSCCAVSGVLMVAFTVPIMVNNFILFYQHVQYRKDNNTSAKSLGKRKKLSNKVANEKVNLYHEN